MALIPRNNLPAGFLMAAERWSTDSLRMMARDVTRWPLEQHLVILTDVADELDRLRELERKVEEWGRRGVNPKYIEAVLGRSKPPGPNISTLEESAFPEPAPIKPGHTFTGGTSRWPP